MTKVTLAPEEAGFDAGRLKRLDKHFATYVDDGRLPGWELALTRGADVVYTASYGWRDREGGVTADGETVWRIASMTKPIASVTAMTLWEEGAFELTDPISKWLPEFENPRVYEKGSSLAPFTVPSREPIRVWHLMSHSSGLSAGFIRSHIVDELYRAAGYEFGAPHGKDLAGVVADFAALPLRFEPGTAWGYGVSTDVLGRLIEIWSGQRLDEAVAARVCEPLSMDDTVWYADAGRAERLSAVYYPDPKTGLAKRNDLFGAAALHEPTLFSGGGGLLSTLDDYTRFTRMLAGGGSFDGTRVLAPATVRMMASNHLPGDLGQLATGGFAETTLDGVGFGLGFAVVENPIAAHNSNSRGEFYWGGALSTAFWVDPTTEITCTFMTSLLPSSTHPIRPQLRQLVYSALVG